MEMIDREKVVKGLECCSAMSGDACRECPYHEECFDNCGMDGIPQLAADALRLLKKQEPKPVESIRDQYFLTYYRCPSCSVQLHRFTGDDRTRYCGRCGQAVIWK